MIEARDFSHRQTFPGLENNFLDKVLRISEKVQFFPSSLFAALLLIFAICYGGNQLENTFLLFSFFLGDWLLIKYLPIAEFSFGPVKSQVLELAILRTMVALFFPFFFINIGLQFFGTLLVLYGFWIEPHHIRVSHQTYQTPHLRSNNSFRMLHLSDLHIERYSQREKELQKLIDSFQPDLILFTGDILNLSRLYDAQSWEDARKVVSQWEAPLGVFGVYGSPAVDLRENMLQLCHGLPVEWLDQKQVTLDIHGDKVDIIGLHCSHKPFIDKSLLRDLYQDNPDHLQILLYHSPDLAPDVAKTGIQIQLSGHTHGGQVCLPMIGSLLTGSLYGRKFQSGKYILDHLTLYISRGIGMEGGGAPRVRFLCPPEIVVWDFSSAH